MHAHLRRACSNGSLILHVQVDFRYTTNIFDGLSKYTSTISVNRYPNFPKTMHIFVGLKIYPNAISVEVEIYETISLNCKQTDLTVRGRFLTYIFNGC